MDMPRTVKQAVILIWATLAVSAVITAVDRRMGLISSELFMGFIATYAVCCVLPYKISKGSNASRYIYSILMVIGFMMMLGGEVSDMTQLDIIASIALLPVEVIIIWWLFAGEAKDWFGKVHPPPVYEVQ